MVFFALCPHGEVNYEIIGNPDQQQHNYDKRNLIAAGEYYFVRFHDVRPSVHPFFVVKKGYRHITEAQQKCAPQEIIELPVKKHENNKTIDPGLEIYIFDEDFLAVAMIKKSCAIRCF